MKHHLKKPLSLLLAVMMCVSLASVLTPAALAADEEAVVTELTVGENKVYVYAPEIRSTVSTTCTAPRFVVFGSEPYTAETAKAAAESSGLAELAAREGAVVSFVDPKGETWSADDVAVYATLIGDWYTDSSTSTYVNGIAEETNFFTGEKTKKIMGSEQKVYLYAEGAGADFVAANLMRSVVLNMTFGDGVTIAFDRTPTSITLCNPTAIPNVSEKADIAVAVLNGPADTAAKLAALTDKALVETSDVTEGFDSKWIAGSYASMSGAWRRQAGALLPIHDWDAQGIVEKVESWTVTTSPDNATFQGQATHPINYVTYYSKSLDVNGSKKLPLVLCFHGGGNTALYEAQATEWPLIGKANGFITVSVDLHFPNCTAAEIVALIDRLKTEYSIDETRVYASGFSMGGCKSWELYEQYPQVFAGLAPMDASAEPGEDSFGAQTAGVNTDTIVPVFYVAGETSPLPETPKQDAKLVRRISNLFTVNQVAKAYDVSFDAKDSWENAEWGVNGDIRYAVGDSVFTDSTMTVELFASRDGRYYTALALAGSQSHEVYARNSWAAWDFLSQFSRNADGTLSIREVTYGRPADDKSVVDNSYNTKAVEVKPAPEVKPEPTPAPEVKPAPTPAAGTTYTVVKGDSLWKIAKELLGSGRKWTAIYEANKDTISDPNLLYIGQTLILP